MTVENRCIINIKMIKLLIAISAKEFLIEIDLRSRNALLEKKKHLALVNAK